MWDLKARLLQLPLATLLGQLRAGTPVYGSGGFTSYSIDRLKDQLGAWAEQGMTLVKMKVGRAPAEDPGRVLAAREAIGASTQLFVDANGAYSRKQALALARRFTELDVRWFEEPVSSDDLPGLRLLRDRAPAGMDIAAGEYGYDPFYFRRMLEAGAVDVLQADATRCGGISGFLAAHALADAHGLPLSAHCAPAIHLHLGCALLRVRHLEYFHDHQRIEQMLFDGTAKPHDGALAPDLTRPGLGTRPEAKGCSTLRRRRSVTMTDLTTVEPFDMAVGGASLGASAVLSAQQIPGQPLGDDGGSGSPARADEIFRPTVGVLATRAG